MCLLSVVRPNYLSQHCRQIKGQPLCGTSAPQWAEAGQRGEAQHYRRSFVPHTFPTFGRKHLEMTCLTSIKEALTLFSFFPFWCFPQELRPRCARSEHERPEHRNPFIPTSSAARPGVWGEPPENRAARYQFSACRGNELLLLLEPTSWLPTTWQLAYEVSSHELHTNLLSTDAAAFVPTWQRSTRTGHIGRSSQPVH